LQLFPATRGMKAANDASCCLMKPRVASSLSSPVFSSNLDAQCRSGSIQGGYQTDAHCATISHIPIPCTQSVGDWMHRGEGLSIKVVANLPSSIWRGAAAHGQDRRPPRRSRWAKATRPDDQRQRKNARPDPGTVGPTASLRRRSSNAIRSRVASFGRAEASYHDISNAWLAHGFLSFESSHASHPVVSG
jgi:hypothetical protein